MKKNMYNHLFVRGPKPDETNETLKRYVAMMDDDVCKGSFFFNCLFMQPKYSTGINGAHWHPYSEVLYFQGTDPDKPEELGWEIDLYMGDEFERHTVTKTTAIYCPQRFTHCPIVTHMKRPVFHIYCMTGPVNVKNDWQGTIKQEGAFDRHYDKYFISGPKPGEKRKEYKKYTTYVDDDVMKGSFHFASAFINGDNPLQTLGTHSHPYPVILGFFGNDADNQFELGAEVEFCVGKEMEKHSFKQSTVVFIPAGVEYTITKSKVNRPYIFVECANGPKLI
ncbi:MAG: hypothetical protein JXA46_11280 [Dehalococcoidales bacterium]|nr:hypothetical protein [Dehalococcoidales bacterium]